MPKEKFLVSVMSTFYADGFNNIRKSTRGVVFDNDIDEDERANSQGLELFNAVHEATSIVPDDDTSKALEILAHALCRADTGTSEAKKDAMIAAAQAYLDSIASSDSA